ncbi:hypothetical protein Plant_43 [Bacillus phage poppyseed]|uniref:Uncharacterized protein n=5 Tax=Pagevirus TaxID=1921184 RepID=A0A0A0RNP2_9CAUD|nr:hypothetical protein Page_43 [Bacillus phage Page]YP_008771360.1 hypothetical protein Pony_42 [Bacillus phage Pony]YP_009152844.1 hypothetical protein CPT_Pookie45 [Bacillus phage Pookie]YP_009197512.1 hypothetical protein AVT25_gp43 [Bacillus phage Pavlov]YP_009210078.1 hypothetical protein AVV20_gp43 [Bacillus phage Palmer]AGY48060.1 hypothetical protein Plant_43 [Bacillus phage poppyseed]AGY47965.1 hypothetical protein Page_43 [Bacillus phage Page]AGY48283.1 hypothetical protein Pony_4
MCELKSTLSLVEMAAKENPAVLKGIHDLLNKYENAGATNTSAKNKHSVKSHIQFNDTHKSLIVFCFNCNLTNELTLKNVISYKCRHCDWENRLSYMQARYMREL